MAKKTFGERMGMSNRRRRGGGAGGSGTGDSGAGGGTAGSFVGVDADAAAAASGPVGSSGDDQLMEISRCNSCDFGGGGANEGTGGSEAGGELDHYHHVVHEKVPVEVVTEGMVRFSFLLETCAPGSVPDPLLIAALLDLVRSRKKLIL